MCYRDSFILLPRETNLPVVWSVSYHHEMILKHLLLTKHIGLSRSQWCPWSYPVNNHSINIDGDTKTYIQIECPRGDIRSWNWDNTEMKKVRQLKQPEINIHTFNSKDDYKLMEPEIVFVLEPVLPSWLEENFNYYYDQVGNTLRKINALRDFQDYLTKLLVPENKVQRTSELKTLVDRSGNIAAEVQFTDLINAYKAIPGFVYDEQHIEGYPV